MWGKIKGTCCKWASVLTYMEGSVGKGCKGAWGMFNIPSLPKAALSSFGCGSRALCFWACHLSRHKIFDSRPLFTLLFQLIEMWTLYTTFSSFELIGCRQNDALHMYIVMWLKTRANLKCWFPKRKSHSIRASQGQEISVSQYAFPILCMWASITCI